MSLTDTKSTTLATTLRSIGRINVVNAYPQPFSLVDASLCHHVEKPLRQFPTSTTTILSVFSYLFNSQVFKNKNSVSGNPLAEFGSGLFEEQLRGLGART